MPPPVCTTKNVGRGEHTGVGAGGQGVDLGVINPVDSTKEMNKINVPPANLDPRPGLVLGIWQLCAPPGCSDVYQKKNGMPGRPGRAHGAESVARGAERAER